MNDKETQFLSRTIQIIKNAQEALQEAYPEEELQSTSKDQHNRMQNDKDNDQDFFLTDEDIFSGNSSDEYVPPTDSGSDEDSYFTYSTKIRRPQREVDNGKKSMISDEQQMVNEGNLGEGNGRSVSKEGELIVEVSNDNNAIDNNNDNIVTSIHDDSNEVKLRKVRNPSLWKRNAQRARKLKGEEYKTQKGKVMLGRPLKIPRCIEKPNHRCSTLVPEDKRVQIYEDFHILPDLQKQREFILKHVKICDKARQTTAGPSRRKVTKVYSFTCDGEERNVCREFFLDTINIAESMIRGAFKKMSSTGVLEPDKRGRKEPPNKFKADDEEFIKKHIFSFPALESHYCRKTSDYKYLDSDLNITTMFKMYKEECTMSGKKPCGFEKYRLVFRSFKLTFHVPKIDLCKRCVKYYELTDEEKLLMETHHLVHLVRKESARRLREEDKEGARADNSILSVNFDLQAVLSTPKGAAGPIFYVRKLAVYNLCVYNLNDHAGHCYVWDETEGKRGGTEISTCIYNFLMGSSGIREVRMMSDSCGGQQKNHNFLFMCLKVVREHPTILKIDHRFFEPGHSQMECDSLHSKIEQKSKKLPVYTTEGWTQIIRLARNKPAPYEVTTLVHNEFIDFNNSNQSFIHYKDKNKTLPFHETVWFQFKKDFPNSVFTKTDYDSEKFDSYEIKLKRGRPSLPVVVNPYKERFKISSAKHNDLIKLCNELIIPRAYHEFYYNLPSSKDIPDRLPEPDVQEESGVEDNLL